MRRTWAVGLAGLVVGAVVGFAGGYGVQAWKLADLRRAVTALSTDNERLQLANAAATAAVDRLQERMGAIEAKMVQVEGLAARCR